jgi:integrase
MSIYRRKDSPYWWVRFTHNGKRILESTGTADRQRAQQYHDRVKAKLWEQSRIGVKPDRTWQEAVVRYCREKSAKRDLNRDIKKFKWLDPHLGNLKLREITRDKLEEIRQAKLGERVHGYKQRTERRCGRSTVNRYMALIRTVLNLASKDWEWIDRAPKVPMYTEPEGRVRFLTEEEEARLLEELPKHQREICRFSLSTGLRQRNVIRLEWSQVDVERQHAWILPGQSKNGRAIAVPLNTKAMEVIQRQVGKHPDYVFTYGGRPIKAVNTKAWREALKRAGISNYRHHDNRHTWATRHRRAGTSVPELQALGGWRSSKMVERYAHFAADHLAAAAERVVSQSDTKLIRSGEQESAAAR